METLLKGLGVSAGTVKGKVRLVKAGEHDNTFKEGEILVTEITDPTMVMMMNEAAGIVCDIGGMTSHPSILSRELGIPCVVATKDATQKLKTGQEVEIDGSTGDVRLVG
jgi:pyruvate, water dikinase